MHLIWYSTYTWMHHIYQRPMHTVEHVAAFHGMESGTHKTYKVEWGILYAVCNFTICWCFCCRSKTWGIISKLQTGSYFWITLEKMGHPQQPTPVNCDNSTAVGIANNTVKHQQSQLMETRFFGCRCSWTGYLGKEKLAGYQSKHHTGAHHKTVQP